MPAPTARPTARPSAGPSARPVGARQLSAQATRESILRAAIKIFAKHGYAGGSVEKISKAAKSYDRMIYYYFGNKEGLFVAVLEETYRRFNEAETGLDLDLEKPVDALAAVIRFAFRYYQKHPEFIRLLNTENLHRGKHIGKSLRAREYSSPAIGVIEKLLHSGVSKGVFRADFAARDLYLLIAAAGYFYQSNRHTLSAFLGENLEAPEALAHWETFVNDIVLRGIAANGAATAAPARRPNAARAVARESLPSID
jgi:AcrR family transcriptional regulator